MYNNFNYQSCEQSIYCGQYTLVFLFLLVEMKFKIHQIEALFRDKKCGEKDVLVQRFFNKIFKNYLFVYYLYFKFLQFNFHKLEDLKV